jgi:hypothetical protein
MIAAPTSTALADSCRAAAVFLRSDLDTLGDDERSIAGLTAVARVLEAAATGAGEAKLRERIGEMADALLAMKHDDELLDQAVAEMHEAHRPKVEKVQTYLYRHVCTCGDTGEPETRKAAATAAGTKHRDAKVTERLTELREQAREAVPA